MSIVLNQILRLKPNLGYLIVDRRYSICYCSENISTFFPDRTGEIGEDFRTYSPSIIDLESHLDRLLQPDLEPIETEINSGNRYLKISYSLLPQESGENSYSEILVVVEDVTEQHQRKQQLDFKEQSDRLLEEIRNQIRQSWGRETILKYTVTQVQNLLEVDRAFIYYFNPDWSGTVVVESVRSPLQSILDRPIEEFYTKDKISFYKQGQLGEFCDLETATLPEKDRQLLRQLQVRSQLVVPIQRGIPLTSSSSIPLNDNHCDLPIISQHSSLSKTYLWGLLVVHHCDRPRLWNPLDIQLLKEIALQLGIAIQQSELYEQLKEANAELKQLAASDSITQLSNNRHFDRTLSKEWRRLARERSPLGMIMCEIDYFKLYKETYGYLSGEFCLQLLADAVRQAIKRPADLVARYGPEEFALLLPHTDLPGTLHVAHIIQNNIIALDIEHKASPISSTITLSMGIVSLRPHVDRPPQLLIELAYQSLDRAKKKGRNQIMADNSSMLLDF